MVKQAEDTVEIFQSRFIYEADILHCECKMICCADILRCEFTTMRKDIKRYIEEMLKIIAAGQEWHSLYS